MATAARIPLCQDLPQDGKLRICQERFQASDHSDTATAQTIKEMCRLIRDSASDPYTMAYAKDAVWRFGGGVSGGLKIGEHVLKFNANDPRVCAWGDFWWTKTHLKFIHHEKLLYSWLNESDQLQLLTKPSDVLKGLLPAEGDCAIYTMMVCSFLTVQNIPWEMVTVKCDPRRPDEYAHIFPRVVLPSGRRVALDASHGSYPGWEVPQEHRFATQVWDSSGDPVPDERWSGLHGYMRRGLGQDDGSSVDTIVDPLTGNVYNTSGQLISGTLAPSTPNQAFGSVPTQTSGGGLSPAEIAAFGQLANTGLNIVGRVVAPTTTITGPGGQQITTPSSSLAALSTSGLTTTLESASPSLWLLLGAGLLLVLFMGHKS
jgi:hypothetical protein